MNNVSMLMHINSQQDVAKIRQIVTACQDKDIEIERKMVAGGIGCVIRCLDSSRHNEFSQIIYESYPYKIDALEIHRRRPGL